MKYEEDPPCNCKENNCKKEPCKGECECKACKFSYMDFLSGMDD